MMVSGPSGPPGPSGQTEALSYRTLISGDMQPWVRRFIKQVGRTINAFDMIREGDRVLLGISGGKDSLALSLALSLRLKWLPVSYELEALHINWAEYPLADNQLRALRVYFSDLGIPFRSVTAGMHPESFNGEFNCYLCSRNRRRILFEAAAERDIDIIALGHHLDDLVETTMINLFFRGDFSTMQPVQEFFKGKLHIIRPMTEIREHTVSRLSQQYNLPTAKPVCPYDSTNIRSKLKPILKEICRVDKLAREHVFKAHEFNCRIPRSGSPSRTAPPGSRSQETE